MSDIDIDTRAILEAEAEQLNLDIGDKMEYISNNYTAVANKIIKEKEDENKNNKRES
jgi:hypothetical protein|tara:strand:+ start:2091 stop:2261 length:171 start_codon:yes stop_codon:yes gene_type:complete